MNNRRNSSIDLLRIISMLMVICNHLISWSNILPDETYALTPMWLVTNTFFVFLLPAVNCFVLISGYFLCTSRFRLKKLISLWLQTAFYSVGIYLLVCCFSDTVAFSLTTLIKSCFPVTMQRYWFITAYFLMYALSPFLNILIRAMNQRMHLMCCIVLFLIFSFAAIVVYISDFSSVYGGYTFIWFCVIYIAGAYIRLYVPTQVKHQKWMFLISAILSLTICGEKYLAHLITPAITGSVVLDGLFYSYNSIIAVPCALALFQAFRGLSIRSGIAGKIIQVLAPLTLASYLIHGHPYFSPILLGFLDTPSYSDSLVLFPVLIFFTLCIYFASCAIEWTRLKLFRLLAIDRGADFVSNIVHKKVASFLSNHQKAEL